MPWHAGYWLIWSEFWQRLVLLFYFLVSLQSLRGYQIYRLDISTIRSGNFCEGTFAELDRNGFELELALKPGTASSRLSF